MRAALAEKVVLHHAARGDQRAEDIGRNNSHDYFHHLWDLDQILLARRPTERLGQAVEQLQPRGSGRPRPTDDLGKDPLMRDLVAALSVGTSVQVSEPTAD